MVPAPDPTALSIDHLEAEGPHTLANCRLAHLFCNNDAQVTKGFDAELARARLHYKLVTNGRVGPGDRFPRRSPLTGDIVNRNQWLRHASTAYDRANTQTERATAQRLCTRLRALFTRLHMDSSIVGNRNSLQDSSRGLRSLCRLASTIPLLRATPPPSAAFAPIPLTSTLDLQHLLRCPGGNQRQPNRRHAVNHTPLPSAGSVRSWEPLAVSDTTSVARDTEVPTA